MNLEILTNSKIVENLGWTLLHSIWQIGLVALVLFFILRLSKNFSANARYSFAVSALILTLLLPLATFVLLENDSVQNQFAEKTYNFENSDSVKIKKQTGDGGRSEEENNEPPFCCPKITFYLRRHREQRKTGRRL